MRLLPNHYVTLLLKKVIIGQKESMPRIHTYFSEGCGVFIEEVHIWKFKSNRMRPFNGVFIQDGALTQVNALSESLTLNSYLPGGKVKPQ